MGFVFMEAFMDHIKVESEPGVGTKVTMTKKIGRRYDVGNRMGFLEATVEYALKRDDLRDDFVKYLKNIVSEY